MCAVLWKTKQSMRHLIGKSTLTHGCSVLSPFSVTVAEEEVPIPKIEYQIDFINKFVQISGTGTWVDIASIGRQIVLIDPDKFVNPSFYFEVVLSSPVGDTVRARLFNITDNVAVPGSELSTASTTRIRLRSGDLASNLIGSKEYKVQLYAPSGTLNELILAVRVIAVDELSGGWNKGEQQIEVGQSDESTTNNTPTELIDPPIWFYEANKYDGTLTIYFEATLFVVSATGYAELWNKTDNTLVAQVSTTSTSPKRVRSGAITLQDGKEYWVKIWNSGSAQITLTGAKIVIQQSGTITKTQLFKKILYWGGTTSTSYVIAYSPVYHNKANLPSSLVIAHEVVIKVAAGGIGYSELYNLTDSASIANSEVLTTSSVYVRVRSVAVSLTTEKEYVSRVRTSGSAYPIEFSTGWIVIDASST